MRRRRLLTPVMVLLAGLFWLCSLGDTQAASDLASIPPLPPALRSTQGKHTLVEFYADWCSTCQMMKPHVKKLKQELQKTLDVVYIDLDNPKNASYKWQYQVHGTPTYFLFNPQGKALYSMQHYISHRVLRTQVLRHLGKLPARPLPKEIGMQSGRPWTLLAFQAKNCAACDQDQAYLSHLEKQSFGKQVAVLRLDSDSQAVNRYMKTLGLQTLPSYVLLDDQSRETYRATGPMQPKSLLQTVMMFVEGLW